MTRQAHTIQGLIDLGQQCGTHFASMFPQWAYFQEDDKEWKKAAKGPTKKTTGKRIKKIGNKVEAPMEDKHYTHYTPKGYTVQGESFIVPDTQATGFANITVDNNGAWNASTDTTTTGDGTW